MDKKIVFFDIDGTIYDSTGVIPDSTVEAIKRLREAGHKTFINSGRARAHIQEKKLLDLGFDGIVSGCGTMVEIDGEVVFYRKIEDELLMHIMEMFKKYNAHVILEGKEFLYMEYDFFENSPYGKRLIKALGDRLLDISETWGNWEASKLCVITDEKTENELIDKLKCHFTFMEHAPHIYELAPVGFSKATGIQKVCEYLNIAMENTYAFGDSVNDTEMMEAVKHSIAMGKSMKELIDICEYQTDDIYEDGIFNACKHFGLI